MLKGINNQSYIDLTNFIDLNTLQSLHKEICYGLAKSKTSTTIYGVGLGDLQQRKSFMDLAKQYKISNDNFDREIFNSLNYNGINFNTLKIIFLGFGLKFEVLRTHYLIKFLF